YFQDVEVERRIEVVTKGPRAGKVVDPGGNAALEVDVVVDRHRHQRRVGAFAHLVAGIEVEQRLVQHRACRAGLRGRGERARGGVAIRHVDAKTQVLLDLGEETREPRMWRRRQRGHHGKRSPLPAGYLLAAGHETELHHLRDRLARGGDLVWSCEPGLDEAE